MSSPRENTNVSTSSSKAVLAALRALQDKIARLELEKTHAMDETAQLRHQLQNQEIEFEHMKNKDSLTSQKALQEARHAYDRLLTDKTELEIRIARLEERNAENRGNTDLLQHKIREVEEEKYQCQLQAKELETEQLQLNLQIDHGHKREKDLTNVLVQETARHETEMSTLNAKVAALEEELEMAAQERAEVNGKLSELDMLVAQLINLNEALVAKLTGKTPRPVSAPKKKAVSKKSGSLPRAATMSTVASESYVAARSDIRRPLHVIVGPGDMDQLRMLHKLYRDRAEHLVPPGVDVAPTPRSRSKSPAGRTKLSKKKSSTSASVLKEDSDCIKGSIDKKYSNGDDSDCDLLNSSGVEVMVNSSTISPTGMPDFTASKKPAFDLGDVIISLEDEYEQLGMQYRWLLSSIHECTDSEREARLAEELVEVIKRMRQKGDQVSALKSPLKAET